MGAVYAKNKTRDMMDRIGAVYATRQIEKRNRSYGCCLCQKQNTRHDRIV